MKDDRKVAQILKNMFGISLVEFGVTKNEQKIIEINNVHTMNKD